MPTLNHRISPTDIAHVATISRRSLLQSLPQVVICEQGVEYYRFASGLTDHGSTSNDLTQIFIDNMYGLGSGVRVFRLGIVAIPTQGRDFENVRQEFLYLLDGVNYRSIARKINIVYDVKRPVYETNRNIQNYAGGRQKIMRFSKTDAESRITPDERQVLQQVAHIIASDEEYTDEERRIMQTIEHIIIEQDITLEDANNTASGIGQLIADLRELNQPNQ